MESNSSAIEEYSEDFSFIFSDILEGNFDSIKFNISDWQKSQLYNISENGVRCLLHNWFTAEKNLDDGTFCNSTWDGLYCWPPTQLGEIITRSCYEILQDTVDEAECFTGTAVRVCLNETEGGYGKWEHGSWTNYSECIASLDNNTSCTTPAIVVAVRYILFIGSILSFLCLATSLFIFYYFKCLRSDRVTVHIHLMIALILRCVLLVVITEPFIFNRSNHYRDVDFVCKMVLSINLYATVASINWMFIQGHYLHSKLTTNVFDRGTPFKVYYSIGWVLPLILIGVWAASMETQHPVKCWKNYSDLPYIWILLGPMIFALLINLLFLINIMRILLTKIQRANTSTDSEQFRCWTCCSMVPKILKRRAVKATAILFPLLGINNLLFLYSPGGDYKKIFVILNTVFQSSQGLFVSILYCFISCDVREAIRREYRRFVTRRSAASTRTNSRKRSSYYTHAAASTVSNRTSFNTKANFRNQLKQTGSLKSQHNISPSHDAADLNHPFNNKPVAQTSSSPSYNFHLNAKHCTVPNETDSLYTVSIPMEDLKL